MRQHNGFGALSKAGASFRATPPGGHLRHPLRHGERRHHRLPGPAATNGTAYTYAVVARNIVGVSEAAEAP